MARRSVGMSAFGAVFKHAPVYGIHAYSIEPLAAASAKAATAVEINVDFMEKSLKGRPGSSSFFGALPVSSG